MNLSNKMQPNVKDKLLRCTTAKAEDCDARCANVIWSTNTWFHPKFSSVRL